MFYATGVHEVTFRVDKFSGLVIYLGVVPASRASQAWKGGRASHVGCTYGSNGRLYRQGSEIRDWSPWSRYQYVAKRFQDREYGVGDEITVRLDLDAFTVAFRKNGATTGGYSPIQIARDKYHFAFDAAVGGDAVTIVGEN